MARFFVSEESIQDNNIVITGPDVRHIAKVLRLKPGDQVFLATGQGREFAAVITVITNKEVSCEIISEKSVSTEPPVRVTLYQGLPKGEKMELVIQKSSELGVTRIVPVICERTVVKLEPRKAQERRERWQRVAGEAAKQSRRTAIPEVSEPLSFGAAMQGLDHHCLSVMPWEQETSEGIRTILQQNKGCIEDVAVFIGPEGGFSDSEAALAQKRGVHLVSLGPRILRTETAGIAVVALILYELGDLGGAVNG